MNLFKFPINGKNPAGIALFAAGLFVLAGGIVFLSSAKNNNELDIQSVKGAKQLSSSIGETDGKLDADNDGLLDDLETILGTDIQKADTDGDGYEDGEEVENGYNPLAVAPGGKYTLSEFEKIKIDIQNFDQEVYAGLFGKEENNAIIPISAMLTISPVISPTAVISSTPAPVISPAVLVSPTPTPEISPVLGLLKEKNINKDWSYLLYIPSGFDKTKEYPLILVFSGAGSVISDVVDNWRGEADKNGFIVAALLPYEKKYPSGNIVESYPWGEADDFAVSVLKGIKKEYKVDGNNIFLAGYFTGATTAYIVALEGGIKFKGVIPIGGYLPLEAGIVNKLINADGLNFYVIHGGNDIDLKTMVAQEKTLVQYGAKMSFVTLPDIMISEYSAEEQEHIAEWMNGLK